MAVHRYFQGGRREFFRLAFGATAALGLGMSSQTALGQTQGGAPLKMATIGSGRIGSALGTLWVKAGHQVMFSSRHPEDLKKLVESLGPLARAGTPAEAIAFADVVLLAVPFGAMPQIARCSMPRIRSCRVTARSLPRPGRKVPGLLRRSCCPGHLWCAPLTRSALRGCQKRGSARRANVSVCRWRVTMPRRSHWRQSSCARLGWSRC